MIDSTQNEIDEELEEIRKGLKVGDTFKVSTVPRCISGPFCINNVRANVQYTLESTSLKEFKVWWKLHYASGETSKFIEVPEPHVAQLVQHHLAEGLIKGGIEEIRKGLKGGDSFLVDAIPNHIANAQDYSYHPLRHNIRYVVAEAPDDGSTGSRHVYSTATGSALLLSEEHIAELILLSEQLEHEQYMARISTPPIEETKMPEPKLIPITPAQIARLHNVYTAAVKSAGSLSAEALLLLLDKDLASFGLKLADDKVDPGPEEHIPDEEVRSIQMKNSSFITEGRWYDVHYASGETRCLRFTNDDGDRDFTPADSCYIVARSRSPAAIMNKEGVRR